MGKDFDSELLELGGGFLPPKPKIAFLYRLIADCDPPIELGRTSAGVKRVIPIIGGRFEGPELRGIVLPVGADWNTSSLDDPGRRTVDTRYILKTDDDAIISLSTLGFSRRSVEVMAMRESGKPVDPSMYYFKQHLFFETASQKYGWLNSIVAFGVVISKFKGGPGVIYDAYVIQ